MIEGKLKPAMPPKKAKQPTKDEVALVRAWVLAGRRDGQHAGDHPCPPSRQRKRWRAGGGACLCPAGKYLAASGRGEVLSPRPENRARFRRQAPGRARPGDSAWPSAKVTLAAASSTAGAGHEVRLCEHRLIGVAVRREQNHHSPRGRHPRPGLQPRWQDPRQSPVTIGSSSCGTWRPARNCACSRITAIPSTAWPSAPTASCWPRGSADRAVKVWDVATGKRLYTLGESTDWVYAVAWSPDGKHLAAAGVDRSIRVWEVDRKGGKIVHSVFAHEGPVTRLVYSADGKTLYSLSEDRSAKAWDTAKMVERKVYARQPETPLALALRPEQKQLAIGRYDGALVLLDESTGKVQGQPLPIKPKPPVLVKIAPGGRGSRQDHRDHAPRQEPARRRGRLDRCRGWWRPPATRRPTS